MNREILFRGKADENGEKIWVYGTPLTNPRGQTFICADMLSGWDVDPATIGQFTGLCDKNGKKIFEGDICRIYHRGDYYTAKAVFNQNTSCYEFWTNVVVGAYGEKATWKFIFGGCSDISVIGNVFDNPELVTP